MKRVDKNTGSEETHGEHTGDLVASSRWPLATMDLVLRLIALLVSQPSLRKLRMTKIHSSIEIS